MPAGVCTSCATMRVEYVGLCSRQGDPSNPWDCACAEPTAPSDSCGNRIISDWGGLTDVSTRAQILLDWSNKKFNYMSPDELWPEHSYPRGKPYVQHHDGAWWLRIPIAGECPWWAGSYKV
jgi:hypothetical protein